jgi:hypothetical protein
MRKSSFILLCAGALATPVMAQDTQQTMPDGMPDHHAAPPATVPPETTPPALPPQASEMAEQATDDSLSPEQQIQFDAWPANVQEYYRTLPPPRQETFWLLTDDYKLKLVELSEEQRGAAWGMIEQKLQERAQAPAPEQEQPPEPTVPETAESEAPESEPQ